MSTLATPPRPATAPAATAAAVGASNVTRASLAGILQIVSFRLATEEYGVDILRAREIIKLGQITPMPETPVFICGLMNVRGQVIPIVDLRRRIGLPAKDADEQTRIIVVDVAGKTIGMVVDAVTDVLRIGAGQIEPPLLSPAGIEHDCLRGLVRLGNRRLMLLDVDGVLTCELATGSRP
ncbi:Chemotaxis protein CheW [Phycisphaerae bacterium RAS1]|nr:Chemotaxis protein CheW [Phycisphaerae bacterium RAS1]